MNQLLGYAMVWDRLSEDFGDGIFERVDRRAIQRTIDEKIDVRAFVGHNQEHVLGRLSAGTLKLEPDSIGLRVTIDPPDTQVARDLVASIKRRDVTQMSIGFTMLEAGWHKEGSRLIRTVRDMRLYEVSPVALPAFVMTHIGLVAEGKGAERSSTPRADVWRRKLAAQRAGW
jgi:HK97 family phage prohead protease